MNNPKEEQKYPTTIKIDHRRSSAFTSAFANGVVLSLAPSGLYNLTFYEDVVGIHSEHLTATSETETSTEFLTDDLHPHKEDKVRVTMKEEDLRSLCALIQRRFPAHGKTDEPE